MNYVLSYKCYPLVLEGYTDADWTTDSDGIKSISGWLFTFSEGVTRGSKKQTWGSKKQTCVSHSVEELHGVLRNKHVIYT